MNGTKPKFIKLRFAMIAGIVSLFTVLIAGTTVYAWFTQYYWIAGNEFQPGKLNSEMEICYWEKTSNAWVEIPGADGTVTAPLGEITDISRLPEDCSVYLKIKAHETSGAQYQYLARVEDVLIDITPVLLSAFDPPEDIDYYEAVPSQQCIQYSSAAGLDNRNAFSIVFGADYPLTEKGQSLSGAGETFISSAQWLYVKLTPTLPELQNIFRIVPILYMPYMIQFTFTIQTETRTLNDAS